ncbi:MAG: peptidoglycan DD-metalloendopeptidase family protein [Bacteriovoracaceae bacterium]|nr:peptidoglycan DD-metalloendopeptidase family protein [Bacteriovoracaceae bacterium]
MKFSKHILIVVQSLFITGAFAATSSSLPELRKQERSIEKIKRKIDEKNAELIKVNAELATIEKNLGKTNTDYIEKVKQIEALEAQITQTRQDFETARITMNNEYKKSKILLNQYLINEVEVESVDELYAAKVYKKLLNDNIANLKAQMENIEQMEANLEKTNAELADLKEQEVYLYKLIMELEEDKKVRANKYLEAVAKKESYEEKLLDKKSQIKKSVAVIEATDVTEEAPVSVSAEDSIYKFQLPIRVFEKFKVEKKGITLTYAQPSDIRATGKGKIVYKGVLSNYGNLVIIEHVNELRTIILGDFKPTVEQDQMVEMDDKIGEATMVQNTVKTVYFEVRKSNKAQPTTQWLDQKSLALLGN